MALRFSPNAQPEERLRDLFPAPVAEEEDNTGWLVTFSDLVLQLFAFALVAAALGGMQKARTTLLAAAPVESSGAAPARALDDDPVAHDLHARVAAELDVAAAPSEPSALRDGVATADVWLPAQDDAASARPTAVKPVSVQPASAQPERMLATAEVEFTGPPAPPLVALAQEPAAGAPAVEKHDARERRLVSVGGYLQAWLEASRMTGGAAVEVRDRELVVSLSDAIGFAPGRAELRGGGQRIVAEVRDLAGGLPDFEIDVSGHTDDRPIRTARFPSNLELSLARAAAVAQEIASGSTDLRARTFARGFGEQRPIASNQSAEGRSRNRRVEIRLVPAA